jgi:hypothetical protein
MIGFILGVLIGFALGKFWSDIKTAVIGDDSD